MGELQRVHQLSAEKLVRLRVRREQLRESRSWVEELQLEDQKRVQALLWHPQL